MHLYRPAGTVRAAKFMATWALLVAKARSMPAILSKRKVFLQPVNFPARLRRRLISALMHNLEACAAAC